MKIISDDCSYMEPGKFYADILVEGGPTAIIIKMNAVKEENLIIDKYDLLDMYAKLLKESNGNEEIPAELEYKTFINWLTNHIGIDEIQITQDLKEFFFMPTDQKDA